MLYKNSKGLTFEVLEGNTSSYSNGQKLKKIKFIETGYTTWVPVSRCKDGAPIKDRFSKTIMGIASLGKAKDELTDRYLYKRWRNMLDRCYNKNCASYRSYGGAGVTVSPEWLIFANFERDALVLPGFNREALVSNRLSLDKDLGATGVSKVYSKETCQWLPLSDNISEAANRQDKERSKLLYEVQTPDGELIRIRGMRELCRRYNLDKGNVSRVIRGEYSHTKGYKIKKLSGEV